MKTLVIEGWRFLPHSYAMVAQHFCLNLARRPEVRLHFRDMPFVKQIAPAQGLWSPEDDRILRTLPPPPADLRPDAVLRFDWPHRFDPDPAAARTFIWGTTEYKIIDPQSIATKRPAREELPGLRSSIIACSRWAASGFINSGAPPDRVAVVPCGVDTAVFHPLPAAERDAIRKALGWEGRFVLLNISAMTGNKGVALLFKAAAQLTTEFPQLLLALKGIDELYSSDKLAKGGITELPPVDRQRLHNHIWYVGLTFSTSRIAQLFQAADAYIAPYYAEGFNLPALEAAACGLPVVCTAGGPTDETLPDQVALRINSYERALEGGRKWLIPNPVHLAELLRKVLTDPDVRRRAAAAGPEWVRTRFTWQHATDQLVQTLFPEPATPKA